MDVARERLEELAAAGRQAAKFGLMKCSSGNLSCRLDGERMLVKASRAWMEEMTAEDVAVCRIADGEVLNGKRASVEIGFHSGMLRARREVNVVLHFQGACATALCCREGAERMDFNMVPEVPYYIGEIGWVEYVTPGTKGLAEQVVAVLAHKNLVMLRNHGQVTVGKTFAEAIQRAVFFEMACEIMVRNAGQGRSLSQEAVRELREVAAGKGFGGA